MKEGQQGEHSSRLSYSLFVRPQVSAQISTRKAGSHALAMWHHSSKCMQA